MYDKVKYVGFIISFEINGTFPCIPKRSININRACRII